MESSGRSNVTTRESLLESTAHTGCHLMKIKFNQKGHENKNNVILA